MIYYQILSLNNYARWLKPIFSKKITIYTNKQKMKEINRDVIKVFKKIQVH